MSKPWYKQLSLQHTSIYSLSYRTRQVIISNDGEITQNSSPRTENSAWLNQSMLLHIKVGRKWKLKRLTQRKFKRYLHNKEKKRQSKLFSPASLHLNWVYPDEHNILQYSILSSHRILSTSYATPIAQFGWWPAFGTLYYWEILVQHCMYFSPWTAPWINPVPELCRLFLWPLALGYAPICIMNHICMCIHTYALRFPLHLVFHL